MRSIGEVVERLFADFGGMAVGHSGGFVKFGSVLIPGFVRGVAGVVAGLIEVAVVIEAVLGRFIMGGTRRLRVLIAVELVASHITQNKSIALRWYAHRDIVVTTQSDVGLMTRRHLQEGLDTCMEIWHSKPNYGLKKNSSRRLG